MDYEKKYKDALGWMQSVYPTMTGADKEDAEHFFPELKESEDERIRKGIIRNLQYLADRAEGFVKDELAERIAWLEKQGDTNETINKDEFAQGVLRGAAVNLIAWIDYNAAEGNMCLSNMECKDIEDALVSGDWDKIYTYIKKKLEKQGEQILANSAKTCKDELTPADKVESKFHKGDWIISNDKKSIYQVIEVKRGIYVIRDNADNHEYHIGIEECEKSGRIWTIHYAKDGDVLYSLDSNQPFIYKERKSNEQATAYCGLNVYGKFFVWGTKDCVITLSNYVPATKEQRDALEKAMTDAGYTFDFEKKELKKIKQKPAWSEEDEQMVDDIIEAIDIQYGSSDYNEMVNWLKSLKDRVGYEANCTTTWKPSDEQIHWLKWAKNVLPDTEKANEAEAVLEDLLEQLKKLRKLK